ncbi:MAG: sigma-70 family RNA polymerase sigma factor, partial [Tepidisphaeraceae bacterium]
MDEATIEAARRGDRPAQGRLLSALQDVWFRFCLSQLRSAEQARDATQETALRFLRQLSSFRGESQLKTWSLSIALNVVREMRRRRCATSENEVDLNQLAPERSSGGFEQADHVESRQLLRAQLANLPDRQREALVLRFFEDLSIDETAIA